MKSDKNNNTFSDDADFDKDSQRIWRCAGDIEDLFGHLRRGFRDSIVRDIQSEGDDYIQMHPDARKSTAPIYSQIVLISRDSQYIAAAFASAPEIDHTSVLEFPIRLGRHKRTGMVETLIGEFHFVGFANSLRLTDGTQVKTPRVYEFRNATTRKGLYTWAAWLIRPQREDPLAFQMRMEGGDLRN
jgi:hypothetical protein